MDPARATEIVQALADGVDPYSGERLPPSSPHRQAEVVHILRVEPGGVADHMGIPA